ncbi:adenylate cyclase [Rhodoferax sp. OV413]|uniref:adenylate/guanylate cyclase domain-containing protein n=1 Tax=Rhodoferax sp. OV413 TaxID=1855285 RepID=UPI0008883685|nr:adenylate/guanylate cyclase domain-containing protein [Rhodoferax sp. OV413]SDO30059.1 adenylate cyclase [Rhodoferax sp. OV413]
MKTDSRMEAQSRLRALLARETGAAVTPAVDAELTAIMDAALGEPAVGQELAVVKREVTILVADLRGFIALTATHPAGTIVTMLNLCLERMSEVIARYQGSIDKFTGDSMTVLFGAHAERPDDVMRAMACAVEMQLAMRLLNDQYQRGRMPELYMGIGINTGSVMVGRFGSESFSQYTVIGNEVSLASRIESFSLRGQVLISENTYKRSNGTVSATEPVDVFVAGKLVPVKLRELIAIPSMHLKVPRQEFRRSHRAEVRIPCSLQILEGTTVLPNPIKAHILDIGYHGVLLELDLPLEVGFDVKLNFDMTLVEYPVTDIYARVMKISHADGLVLAGLEFTALGTETNTKLQMFVQMLVGAA